MEMMQIICKCGHPKSLHWQQYKRASDLSSTKDDCFFKFKSDGEYCECSQFCADNLSTIEQLAKSKGLVRWKLTS